MKESDERATPDELFIPLYNEFKFTLDVCATQDNAKVSNYFTLEREQNGLFLNWAPNRCFMNPPYSEIPKWLGKARLESMIGALVVGILPTDSSTKWFHEYIWDKTIHSFRSDVQVRYPDTRYSFGEHTNSAKFPTMIVIFGL